MRESLDERDKDKESPIVLDTTGSVIYTGYDILKTLREKTRVIYLEATESHIAALFKNYMAYPKPVIWGESYRAKGQEESRKTLERCYPELLRDRARRYKEIAHVSIPYEQLKTHWADIGTFILDFVK